MRIDEEQTFDVEVSNGKGFEDISSGVVLTVFVYTLDRKILNTKVKELL